ncbi:MAG: DUF6067 family protein [Candidatus Pacebacteria bacterium]|nr:DUF6067 family protein [Candidatus Paceibacterota bacterium]
MHRNALVITLLLAAGIVSAQDTPYPEARLPRMPAAPNIDGHMTSDEWRGSTSFHGLGNPVEPREGQAWFGYDRENLYVAFRTQMPPTGQLITNVKRDGVEVVMDDSVELWVVPPDKGRSLDGPKGKGYFQLIVNSTGMSYRRHHEPGYGLPAATWHPDICWASSTDDDYWYLELAIPLTDLGVEELILPATWKIRLVRNWKNPWNQAAVPQAVHFGDTQSMAAIRLDQESCAVRIDTPRTSPDGERDLPINLYNPRETSLSALLDVKILAGNKTLVDEQKTVSLSGKASKTVRIPLRETMAGREVLTVQVTDAETNQTAYQRTVVLTPKPDKLWTLPEADLAFYLPFDKKTVLPTVAKGKKKPVEAEGNYDFIDGIKGQAVYFKENARLLYDNQRNLPIPGAVSFWVKVFRDRRPPSSDAEPSHNHSYTTFWRTQFKGNGYLGIQDSVYGLLLFFFHHFPGIRDGHIGAGFPWQQGKWFHICANIREDGAELFLDGKKLGQTTFERQLKSDELSPFLIGGAGQAIDELKIFSRTLTPAEVAKQALGQESIDGKISWFPTINSLVFEAIAEPDTASGPPLKIVLQGQDEEAVIASYTIAEKDWNKTDAKTVRIRKVMALPELEQGTYRAFLRREESDKTEHRLLSKDIVVKHYEWANNELGKSNVIIPPFTPLNVSKNEVSCILRTYRLGPLGLPAQVTSLEKDILSRPISLTMVADGQPVEWKETAPVEFEEMQPHTVRFKASAANEIMDITSVGTVEYDGLLTLRLSITPKATAKSIDSMALDIPVKDDIAQLFHAVGEHIRANPAGIIPAGNGVVFESRRIPQPRIDNFIPYIWIGQERRGICWVADWDKDWVHSDTRSAVELVRNDGEVMIRVNILNGPLTLDRKRHIEFALMASPVKPMPEGWKEKVFNFDYPGRTKYTILWTASAGFHYGWASRYPLDQDWSLIDKLVETQKTGTIDDAFVDAWVKKVMDHPGPLNHRASEKYVRHHVKSGFYRARDMHEQGSEDCRLIPYSVAAAGTGHLPEHEVYGDEWQFQRPMNCSQSFRDYAVWYAAKMIDHGMRGIYVDNSFATAKYTWPMGEGYIGDDGEVHPNLGILSRTRQLVKRLAAMMVEKGMDPFVYVHMTNGNTLPMLSFAQANLGWEWKYGGADCQEKFTPGYIRAVNTGQQTGTIPVVLGGVAGVDKDPVEKARLTRTFLAMTLPHHFFVYAHVDSATAIAVRDRMLEFMEGRKTHTHFYWNNRHILDAPENLMVTVHEADNELLLVIGNLGKAGTYEITLNMTELNASGIQQTINQETGEPIPVKNNQVSLDIAKHDLALLHMTLE